LSTLNIDVTEQIHVHVTGCGLHVCRTGIQFYGLTSPKFFTWISISIMSWSFFVLNHIRWEVGWMFILLILN